jgi:hypothetical protein
MGITQGLKDRIIDSMKIRETKETLRDIDEAGTDELFGIMLLALYEQL